MPEVETLDRVPENGMIIDDDTQNSFGSESDVGVHEKVKGKKTKKRGIIYLSTIPPYMNVAKIREIFSAFGEIGRIYLQLSGSKYDEVINLGVFVLPPIWVEESSWGNERLFAPMPAS